jgi:hypothetical protein
MRSSTLGRVVAACLCLSPVARAASPGTPDWSCTARGATLPNWSHPAALASNEVLAVHVVEAYSQRGLGGLAVRACDVSDETCATPLARATTDDAGAATLTVRRGADQEGGTFGGYLEVTGEGMPTNLVFFDGRTASEGGFFDVVVYTTQALGITASLAGVKLDPQRGVVRIEARDCAHAPAAGVSLALSSGDAQTSLAYSTGSGASLSRGREATTDRTGVAVAFGVKPGGFGVHEGRGQHGVGGALAFARASAVSSVVALP